MVLREAGGAGVYGRRLGEEMADADQEEKRNGARSARGQKKRARNPEEWHKQKQKRLRIAGKAHINTNGQHVAEKRPGPDCRCRRKCYQKIPEPVRLKTFEGFYSMRTHDEQNAYLFGLMRQVDIKRKRRKNSSRRTCTFEYFVRVRGRETQVCQTAFKNIHAITERKVRVLCKKMDDGVMFPSDNRGKNNSGRAGIVRLPQEIINQIKTHIYTIVHTHRLKDFIRVDRGKGLEINISKMWKDYIKTHDPAHEFATQAKTKKRPGPEGEAPPPPPPPPAAPETVPATPVESYAAAYQTAGGLMTLTDGYLTQTMVPAQFGAQHVTMTNYILPEKMIYFPDGQVVVESSNIQQLLQTANGVPSVGEASAPRALGVPNADGGAYLIVQPAPAPKEIPPAAEPPEETKPREKKPRTGPDVKQWRYTSIFHDEFNGVALAAIKTRLPLYYSERFSPKKKTSAKSPAKDETQQPTQTKDNFRPAILQKDNYRQPPKEDHRQPIQIQCHQICPPQQCQPHPCQQIQCQIQSSQQQECQQQQHQQQHHQQQQQQHQQQQHQHQQQHQQQLCQQQQMPQTQVGIISIQRNF